MAATTPSVERAGGVARSSAALNFLKASPKKLLIGGKWVAAKSGKTFETINPATEEVLALVAEGDKADVDEAVKAARKAFEEGKWSKIGPHQRARYLFKIADLIEQNARRAGRARDARQRQGDIPRRARSTLPARPETFRYYGGWCTKIYGETNPSDPTMFNYTLREPVGVCGQIIPWNFPLLMAAWKLGPALACGNTVILKPAEQTPLTALRLGELILEAGMPEGVVNIITGFGPGAGSSIAEHPDIDKVAFTGSTEVGKIILQGVGGQSEARVAGARRQVAQHHLPRRRYGAGGSELDDGRVFQLGTGLLRRHAHLRAEGRLRQVHRSSSPSSAPA